MLDYSAERKVGAGDCVRYVKQFDADNNVKIVTMKELYVMYKQLAIYHHGVFFYSIVVVQWSYIQSITVAATKTIDSHELLSRSQMNTTVIIIVYYQDILILCFTVMC